MRAGMRRLRASELVLQRRDRQVIDSGSDSDADNICACRRGARESLLHRGHCTLLRWLQLCRKVLLVHP